MEEKILQDIIWECPWNTTVPLLRKAKMLKVFSDSDRAASYDE